MEFSLCGKITDPLTLQWTNETINVQDLVLFFSDKDAINEADKLFMDDRRITGGLWISTSSRSSELSDRKWNQASG